MSLLVLLSRLRKCFIIAYQPPLLTELCWTCSLEKRCTHISTPSFTNVDMVILGKKQKLCLFCPSILKILSKEFQRFFSTQNWPFLAFLMNFCLLKCKYSSLRSKCWMRLFLWFFWKVRNLKGKCIPQCLKISLAWTLSWFPTIWEVARLGSTFR